MLVAARPDLLLVDAQVPRGTEDDWAAAWSRNGPEVRVLVLGTAEEESAILGWIESGADGVHLKEKSLEDLICDIEHLLKGEVVCPPELFPCLFARLAARGRVSDPTAGPAYQSLTQREREIHRMLIECLSNKQIATRLRLSLHTVKNHVQRL